MENFWCSQQYSNQSLAKQAISTLIPFATTYRSEAAFSALITIKTKQRNRLDVQHDMRVALLKTQPQFSVLVQKRQQQASHVSTRSLRSFDNLLFKFNVSLPLVTGELLQKTVGVNNVTYKLYNIKL